MFGLGQPAIDIVGLRQVTVAPAPAVDGAVPAFGGVDEAADVP